MILFYIWQISYGPMSFTLSIFNTANIAIYFSLGQFRQRQFRWDLPQTFKQIAKSNGPTSFEGYDKIEAMVPSESLNLLFPIALHSSWYNVGHINYRQDFFLSVLSLSWYIFSILFLKTQAPSDTKLLLWKALVDQDYCCLINTTSENNKFLLKVIFIVHLDFKKLLLDKLFVGKYLKN